MRGEFLIGPPESDACRRTMSVPSLGVEELAQHLAVHGEGTELVFGAAASGPIRRTNSRHWIWSPSVRAEVGEPCTFHDLRHSHTALLIAHGEHPEVVQGRLGHAAMKSTLDAYGHLFDGADEVLAERLDASWRDFRVDARRTRRD